MTAFSDPIPEQVLEAFGAVGTPTALAGGLGTALRVGDLVLKQVADTAATAGMSRIIDDVAVDGVRLARPVRTGDGRWVVGGWAATEYVAGEWGLPGRELDALGALDKLHNAFRSSVTEPPPWLTARSDAWATADRIVWGELTLPLLDHAWLEAILRRCGPLPDLRSQLVNGDPNEQNILFAPDRPPAIIDIAPYWRPPGYSIAILLADAIAWQGSDPGVLTYGKHLDAWPQLVGRAIAFRLVTTALRMPHDLTDRLARYEPVLALIGD